MNNKIFIFLLSILLIVGFISRLLIIRNNNFYFTVDQGRDAVYVREILERKQIILKGPETSVRGVFALPLWYYFIGIGYLIFGGHPFGASFMLTILNLATSVLLVIWISREIGRIKAILIGFGLQFFWWFFYTSLWGFNPFPLISLAIVLILFLTRFLAKKIKYYFYALIPILLAFNANIAGAMVLLIFYILIGLLAWHKKLITLISFVVSIVPFFVLGILAIIGGFVSKGQATGTGLGIFSGTNFGVTIPNFIEMLSQATIPQNLIIGVFIFFIVFLLYLRNKKQEFSNRFIVLTLVLYISSFVFFSFSRGWRDWQTVYLPPLLFVSYILMLFSLPKRIGISLLAFTFVFQLAFFVQKYKSYQGTSKDPSILSNQQKIIDWIYSHGEDQGFSVYTYTNTFYDYPYQYLFWWYARPKYSYLPCEYSNFPLSHKELYVPGYQYYLKPDRGCGRLRFIIIESDTNGEANKDWIDKFKNYNDLIDKQDVGKVKIEKYYTKKESPNDYCLWWGRCD